MSSYKIGLVGTGNMAWHLARAYENAGHAIVSTYNRDLKKAEKFSLDFFNARAQNHLEFRKSNADIFILAVSDDAIPEIAEGISLPSDCILAHTSGTVPLKAIGYSATENRGIFYPLQTLSKGKPIDFNQVPIFIEAENRQTKEKLTVLAKSISQNVKVFDSQERAKIHLAAVFASNFSNHMLTIAKGILESNGLDYELLKPLITETINKSLSIGPESAQTGPAKRADLEILDKHFEALQNDKQVAEIYKTISQHIIDFYQE